MNSPQPECVCNETSTNQRNRPRDLLELPESDAADETLAKVLLGQVPNGELLEDPQNRKTRFCRYCGDFSQSRDHVTPVAYTSVYRTFRSTDTVPCCAMCNTLAGDFVAFGVIDKAWYLKDRYERRFRILLQKQPEWSEWELRQLGKNLRHFISRKLFLKELIKAKIENLDLCMNGYPLKPIIEPWKLAVFA